MLAKVRLSGKLAIAVVSSGIVSLLLMGGRTAHSTFKIPLKLNESSTYSITKTFLVQKLIKEASLIIWDEAPMSHRQAFEVVNRTLRDILENDTEPFGGNVFVLSGDVRQILPVVKKGTPGETINACLKSSMLLLLFQTLVSRRTCECERMILLTLLKEMAAFSDFLLQVGEGRYGVNAALSSDYIKIPHEILIENPVADEEDDAEIRPGAIPRGMNRITDEMYAGIKNPEIATDECFTNRTIITTTTTIVHQSMTR
ncbi:hypothetical protein PC128_g20667 [Phytophthora cactorum]|nr:hypothetical protein PC120_g18636 [Phytophthora cactorum]KAG3162131.1 hypothetical protein PC128_g20667 [Phytophthora cactorum]KAG4045453.1 hypothetical protein PC123_g19136 [Phytophthora cactorum]